MPFDTSFFWWRSDGKIWQNGLSEQDKLHRKNEIDGPRVFIGEFTIPAKKLGYDKIKHENVNREIIIKYLKSGVSYILYWQMYNNEINNKIPEGYWLIDDKNQKQPLYLTLEGLYQAQKNFTHTREQSIAWLRSVDNLVQV